VDGFLWDTPPSRPSPCSPEGRGYASLTPGGARCHREEERQEAAPGIPTRCRRGPFCCFTAGTGPGRGDQPETNILRASAKCVSTADSIRAVLAALANRRPRRGSLGRHQFCFRSTQSRWLAAHVADGNASSASGSRRLHRPERLLPPEGGTPQAYLLSCGWPTSRWRPPGNAPNRIPQ